jgi:hypothetical protein
MRTALALLLACGPAWGQTCTIVTNGAVSIYEHEIAHCNGWKHEPFVQAVVPRRFVFPYVGRLTIHMVGTDYQGQMDTMLLAPVGTRYIYHENVTVWSICQQLWLDGGMVVSEKQLNNGRLVGCSVPW